MERPSASQVMSLGKIEPCSEYSQVALSNRVAPSDSYLD